MSLLKFLGLSQQDAQEPSTDNESIRKIVQSLDKLDADRARYLGMFAYILGRVANADMSVSDEETREMESIVQELGNLPEDQSILVVQMAKTQNRLFGGTDNFLITREFNKVATREQKLALLRCLFAVSSSDQEISGSEDREIRLITSELKLEHNDFIAVRSDYREYLSVLKKRRGQT